MISKEINLHRIFNYCKSGRHDLFNVGSLDTIRLYFLVYNTTVCYKYKDFLITINYNYKTHVFSILIETSQAFYKIPIYKGSLSKLKYYVKKICNNFYSFCTIPF